MVKMEIRNDGIKQLMDEINELKDRNDELKYLNKELKDINHDLEKKNKLLHETIVDIVNYYSGNGFVPRDIVSLLLKL